MKPSKQLHIVHIIPALPFGGAERFLVDLINNCTDNIRFSIIIFFDRRDMASEIQKPGVQIRVVPKQGKVSLHLFGDLRKALQDLRPDIVHTHLFGGDFWGRIAAWSLGIPVLTTEHNVNVDETWLQQCLKRVMRGMSRAYACPSRAIAAFMQAKYGIVGAAVIRYGIVLSRFATVSEPSLKKPLRFLVLGRITQQKGQADALRALSQLKNYDWTLDIVGEGPLHHSLITLAHELGMAGRVQILEPRADVASLFAVHDVLLMPSHWEGLGIVIMEAMAAGRLVVASCVGGIPELVEHKKNGLLHEAGDIEALSGLLKKVLTEPEQFMPLLQNAREKATKEFGVEAMCRSYEKIYKNLSRCERSLGGGPAGT